jgi:hypothetical protein
MWRRWVVVAGLTAVSMSAMGDNGNAAREALRSGQYETVLRMTQQTAIAEPASAINWYRMAIAATRLGDKSLGALALSNARLHDPTLSFATSPARVTALQAEIDSGATADLLPPVILSDAREMFGVEPVPTIAQSSAPQPPDTILIERMDAINSKRDQIGERAVTAQKQADWWQAAQAWVVGFFILCFSLGALIAVILDRQVKKMRQVRSQDIARMSLADMIVFNRDHTAMLRDRLYSHGHKETALMQSISRYLPVVELESGRANVKLQELTRGCILVDDASPLEPPRPVLGQIEPQKVHQSILARLQAVKPGAVPQKGKAPAPQDAAA